MFLSAESPYRAWMYGRLQSAQTLNSGYAMEAWDTKIVHYTYTLAVLTESVKMAKRLP